MSVSTDVLGQLLGNVRTSVSFHFLPFSAAPEWRAAPKRPTFQIQLKIFLSPKSHQNLRLEFVTH